MSRSWVLMPFVASILAAFACGGGATPITAPKAGACEAGTKACKGGDVVRCEDGEWALDYDCSANEPCVDDELNGPRCEG